MSKDRPNGHVNEHPFDRKTISLLTEAIVSLAENAKAQTEWLKSHLSAVTKQDLEEMERRFNNRMQEAIDALVKVSTAADSLSIKVDKLEAATTKLIEVVKSGGTPSPALKAAIATAEAAAANAAREGDEVDAAVKAADEVLPEPAPAGDQ